jgi:toxin ParE1/3/4
MAKVRWSAEAETWLKDIYGYIATDNPEAAASVVDGIYQRTQTLKKFPDIGHVHRYEEEGEIRILLYGHYRIAYLRRKDKDVVDILGVFHGALEIDRYLEPA